MNVLAQDVPGGAGDVGDDGRLLLGKGVEQAGLAGVGAPGDHHAHALSHQCPLAGGCTHLGKLRHHPLKPLGHLAVGQEVDLLLGEVDGRLHVDPQLDEPLDQRRDPPREGALQRAQGVLGGAPGAGVDQVGDRLGLGQVELVVEEGPLGEFARAGQAGAQLQAALQQQVHDHRAAVALQLQHVLAGEGVGAGEPEGDALVDHPLGALEGAVEGVAGRGAVAQHRLGDRRAQGPGEANDADTPAPGRGGEGGDGVLVVKAGHGILLGWRCHCPYRVPKTPDPRTGRGSGLARGG